MVAEGGVGGVEQPVPDREVGWHCGWLSIEMLRADDDLRGGLTVNVWLSGTERHDGLGVNCLVLMIIERMKERGLYLS